MIELELLKGRFGRAALRPTRPAMLRIARARGLLTYPFLIRADYGLSTIDVDKGRSALRPDLAP